MIHTIYDGVVDVDPVCCLPIRRHGNKICRHQPDAYVGAERQQLRNRGKRHAQIGEPFAVSAEFQKCRYALLLFSSHISFFPVSAQKTQRAAPLWGVQTFVNRSKLNESNGPVSRLCAI